MDRYYDVIHGEIELPKIVTKDGEDLVAEIMNSSIMRRMQGQKQLGLASYVVYPGANHTRFDHSVGTMYLVAELVSKLEKNLKSRIEDPSQNEEEKGELEKVLINLTNNKDIIILAALLHDIGNGPFPLTVNAVLKRHPEWYKVVYDSLFPPKRERIRRIPLYDAFGYYLISKRNSEIYSILNKKFPDFQIKKIARIAAGIYDPQKEKEDFEEEYLNQIITGNLGVHKLDFLARDAHFTGMSYSSASIPTILDSIVLRKMKWKYDENGREIKGTKIVVAVNEENISLAESMLIARVHNLSAIAHQPILREAEAMLTEFLGYAIWHYTHEGKKKEVVKLIKEIFEAYSDSDLIKLIKEEIPSEKKEILDALFTGRYKEYVSLATYRIKTLNPIQRYNLYLLAKPPEEETPPQIDREKPFIKKLEENLKEKIISLAKKTVELSKDQLIIYTTISKTLQRDVYIYEKQEDRNIEAFSFIFDKSDLVSGLTHSIFGYGTIGIYYYLREEEKNKKTEIDKFFSSNRLEIGKKIDEVIVRVEKEEFINKKETKYGLFRNTDHILSILYILNELGEEYYGDDIASYLKDCRKMFKIVKELDDRFRGYKWFGEETGRETLFRGYRYELQEDYKNNIKIRYPIRCSELYEDMIRLSVFGLVERRRRIVVEYAEEYTEEPFFRDRYDLRLHLDGRNYVKEYLRKNKDYYEKIYRKIEGFLVWRWKEKGDRRRLVQINILEEAIRGIEESKDRKEEISGWLKDIREVLWKRREEKREELEKKGEKQEAEKIWRDYKKRIEKIKNLRSSNQLSPKIDSVIKDAKREARKIEEEISLYIQPVMRRKFKEKLEEKTLLHIDIARSTEITAKADVDDIEIFEDFHNHVEEILREETKGINVKEIMAWSGDGCLAILSDPNQAVEAAIKIQEGMGDIKSSRGDKIEARIGINLASFPVHHLEEIKEIGKATHRAINYAGHFQKECPPGKILISESTYKNLKGDIQNQFKKHKNEKGKKIKIDGVDTYIWKG
jgi:hypothetical protein